MSFQRISLVIDLRLVPAPSRPGEYRVGNEGSDLMVASEEAEAEEQPLKQLRRYVEPHPEWPDDFILIARTEDGEQLTIVRVADVKPSDDSMDNADA